MRKKSENTGRIGISGSAALAHTKFALFLVSVSLSVSSSSSVNWPCAKKTEARMPSSAEPAERHKSMDDPWNTEISGEGATGLGGEEAYLSYCTSTHFA